MNLSLSFAWKFLIIWSNCAAAFFFLIVGEPQEEYFHLPLRTASLMALNPCFPFTGPLPAPILWTFLLTAFCCLWGQQSSRVSSLCWSPHMSACLNGVISWPSRAPRLRGSACYVAHFTFRPSRFLDAVLLLLSVCLPAPPLPNNQSHRVRALPEKSVVGFDKKK